MGLPFLDNLSAKVDQIIAIDLGTRTTKAVYLQRRDGKFVLLDYVLQEVPVFEKRLSNELLAEHLRTVVRNFKARTKRVVMVIPVADSLISHAEMPAVDISDMRKMVRLNAKSYFQQDLPDHAFDCYAVPASSESASTGKTSAKMRAVVGAASQSFLTELESAANDAGLILEAVTLSHLGATNAFLALPEEPHKGAVALVDIGFANTTVSILLDRELRFSRVVNIGADMLTTGLAESLNITYPVAEGLKQIMPDKVQSKLQTLLAPLARELRTSIDFFEHQQENIVSEIYVSGGSVRSASLVQMLQSELNLPCKPWDPSRSFVIELPSALQSKIKEDAPQLATALSAGLAVLNPNLISLDLLAEERDAQALRRRDPVKLGYFIGALSIVLILIWGSYLKIRSTDADAAVDRKLASLKVLQKASLEVSAEAKRAGELERTLKTLQQWKTNRFEWAPAFDALKHTVVDDIQVVRIKTDQTVSYIPALKAVTNNNVVVAAKPAITTEKITVNIQAKDFADPPAAEKFMESIKANPWFQKHLRKNEPIRLKDRLAPQVDPADPTKTFILFTVECYAERIF